MATNQQGKLQQDQQTDIVAPISTSTYVEGLERLWDMVSDMVEDGRLAEAAVPGDYKSLVAHMVSLEGLRVASQGKLQQDQQAGAKMSLADLYRHWDEFGDVPTVDEGEDVDCIEQPFLHFDAGTHREEVWHWFESQNPRFIVGEVMAGVRHSDEQGKLRQKQARPGEVVIQCGDVRSTQDWTVDPDMIQIAIEADFIAKADACVAFMQANNVDYVGCTWALSFDLFEDADNLDDEELEGKSIVLDAEGKEYVQFEPKYGLNGCSAKINKDGEITAICDFAETDDTLWCSVGNVAELKKRLGVEMGAEHQTVACSSPSP